MTNPSLLLRSLMLGAAYAEARFHNGPHVELLVTQTGVTARASAYPGRGEAHVSWSDLNDDPNDPVSKAIDAAIYNLGHRR